MLLAAIKNQYYSANKGDYYSVMQEIHCSTIHKFKWQQIIL